MPLLYHHCHGHRGTRAPACVPGSWVQDPARVCWLGGKLPSTWTGMGCLKGRFQRGDSPPETWLIRLSHHSIRLQAYFEMSPSFRQGLSFFPAHVWEASAFSGGSLIRVCRAPHPLLLVLSKTVTLKLIFPRGGTLRNQIMYVV